MRALQETFATVRMRPMCSCGDMEIITMPSKRTRANCHLTVERTPSFARRSVPRALRKPNDKRMTGEVRSGT